MNFNGLSAQLSRQEMLQILGGTSECLSYKGKYETEVKCEPLDPKFRCFNIMSVYEVWTCNNQGKLIKYVKDVEKVDGSRSEPVPTGSVASFASMDMLVAALPTTFMGTAMSISAVSGASFSLA